MEAPSLGDSEGGDLALGDVALVRWPAQRRHLALLREAGRPRLLLVEDGPPPELGGDCLEDWVRVPAPEVDLRARVGGLRLRQGAHGAGPPVLDDDGVLRFAGGWVALPPLEARLADALIDRLGAVVSRAALTRAGWGEGTRARNALDVHMLRLRRRLEPLGLRIATVRSRGYLLDASGSRQETVRDA